jgi:hypothetical protein
MKINHFEYGYLTGDEEMWSTWGAVAAEVAVAAERWIEAMTASRTELGSTTLEVEMSEKRLRDMLQNAVTADRIWTSVRVADLKAALDELDDLRGELACRDTDEDEAAMAADAS